MTARLDGGWLVVPYAGPALAPCHIATGTRGPGEWQPAFKAVRGGQRVLQVRPPASSGPVRVWVKISGAVTAAGQVTL
jgi:hypothetical protein